jgi:hypothetical protein
MDILDIVVEEVKTASRFDEEFLHMVEMTEALKDIAAAAKKGALRPSKYLVLEEIDPIKLGAAVEYRLEQGWVLHGGLTVTPYDGAFYYHQAMIKREAEVLGL